MKKVVYNASYGGYGLSPIATYAIAKRKGLNPSIYIERENNLFQKINLNELKYFDGDEDIFISIKDVGDFFEGNLYNEDIIYNAIDLPRTDKDLVSVVEDLAEKANGLHANLRIKVVKDKYRILEYDGSETVETPESIMWLE